MLERGNRRWPAVVLGTAVVLSTAGCGPRPAPADAAARVGDEIVPYAEFEAYVSGRVGLAAASSSRVLSGLLDQYLDEALLRLLALDEGRVDGDGDGGGGGGGAGDGEVAGWQVVDALLAGREPPPVSEEEIAVFYRANPDSFERPERVLLNQVLAEQRETAGRVARRMAAGDDYAALAAAFSSGVSINQSEITRDDLPVAFVDRIFALETGEVSEVIEADYGYHVFQVVARLPAARWPLAEARPRIVEILGRQGRRRMLANLVAEARGRYNVEVYARNLPFNYEGQYDSPNS